MIQKTIRSSYSKKRADAKDIVYVLTLSAASYIKNRPVPGVSLLLMGGCK